MVYSVRSGELVSTDSSIKRNRLTSRKTLRQRGIHTYRQLNNYTIRKIDIAADTVTDRQLV